jgi:putative component of toxin-antitoxin plasmid stabilization module
MELYRNHRHSVAIEYRIHHLSNAYIGDNNPGVDSGIFKLTYSSSRR